jgi:MFS family permease
MNRNGKQTPTDEASVSHGPTELPSPRASDPTGRDATAPEQAHRGAAIAVVCVALFVDMLVYGLAIPVLPTLPATVDAGPTGTGLLFAAYAAALLLITPLAGRLVDRHGPRLPLLIALIGLGAATLLFAAGGPYAVLLVGRACQGAAAGLSWVAGLSLIALVTPLSERAKWLGLAMSMISVGVLAGTPLGGFVAEHWGTHAPFLIAAGIALLDAVARVLLVPRLAATVNDDPTGPAAVLRVPGSLAVVGLVIVQAGLIAALEPVLPLHLADRLGANATRIGLLFGLTVVVGAILNPLVGGLVHSVGGRLLTGLGVLVGAISIGWAGIAGSSWSAASAMALLGVATALVAAPAVTLIGVQGMRTRPPALGGAYALFNIAYGVGLLLGPVLSGPLTGALGIGGALAAIAAVTLVGGGLAAMRAPAIDAATPGSTPASAPASR